MRGQPIKCMISCKRVDIERCMYLYGRSLDFMINLFIIYNYVILIFERGVSFDLIFIHFFPLELFPCRSFCINNP